MANFNSLEELLNTTAGMTVLRNNVKQDDGVDTVVGVDWFKFNDNVASTIYVSGNSWIGFGISAAQLRVCDRNGAMYYLYRQEGTIGHIRFLKLRWKGYSYYNSISSTYGLEYEVFLFNTGDIYLNLIDVPNSASYMGTSQLVCGANTYPYTVALNTPVEYTFESQDVTGSTWQIVSGRPVLQLRYASEGIAMYYVTGMDAIDVAGSGIFWVEDVPEDTTLTVFVSLDGEDFTIVDNAGPIVEPGADVTGLWIKIKMETENIYVTPSFSQLRLWFIDVNDEHVLILYMNSRDRFCSAVGDISLAYDASIGNLSGVGGPVDDFSLTFTPEDLIAKPHQHIRELIEVNLIANGGLLRVYHSFYKSDDEHIDVSNISAIGVLTDIDDI